MLRDALEHKLYQSAIVTAQRRSIAAHPLPILPLAATSNAAVLTLTVNAEPTTVSSSTDGVRRPARESGTPLAASDLMKGEAMPKSDKRPKRRKRSQPASHNKERKVGSDPAADREIGGELDFGYSAATVKAPLPDGGREKGHEPGTGPMRSGEDGNRVYGVGHPPRASRHRQRG